MAFGRSSVNGSGHQSYHIYERFELHGVNGYSDESALRMEKDDSISSFNETVLFEFVRGLSGGAGVGGTEGEKNFMALFLLIIPMMTVFGNLLVVLSVYRERALRSATNYLIISMAGADLLVAICVMPFAVYVEVQNGLWKLPKTLCTCYTAIDVCASTASILNLVAISWDRYMAVSKPIEYSQSRTRKNRRVYKMITGVWSISLVIALPMVTGLNRLDDTPYCEFTNAVYIIASSFASFFLPCLVMVGLYGVVLRKLRERQEQRYRSNNRGCSQKKSEKRSFFASPFRHSFISSNERSTTNNDVSVVDRGFPSQAYDPDPVSNVVLPSPSFHDRFESTENRRHRHHPTEDVSESALITPSPRMLTSSTQLTAPASSPFCRKIFNGPIDRPTGGRNRLEIEKETRNAWCTNNNTVKTVSYDRERIDKLIAENRGGKAFELLESESVPFIDASSVQCTPSRKHKSINHHQPPAPLSNEAPRHLATSTNSISSIFQLVRANSLSAIPRHVGDSSIVVNNKHARESSPLPRRRTCREVIDELNGRTPRRASVSPVDDDSRPQSIDSSLVNDSLWPLTMGMRYRGCFADMLEVYRRRAATCSAAAAAAAAAAAKYSRQSRKERRATHTLAVVLVVFLCCWLPFFTCHMTNSVCMVRAGDTCIPIVAFFFGSWLGYMNSFMNPVIYTIFNPEYRRAFKNILCCRRAGGHR